MMNGMFTDRVKKVMQIAREEAVRLGNDYVGTEHLLLGLIKEGDGVAVAVLRSMSVDLDELAANIEKAITSTGGMMTIGQMLPFTPRAKKVLEIAANEARSMSHKYIGTEHLLLALMKDTESTASNALASAGLEYDRVKEEISRVLRGGESVGTPKEKSKTPFLDHFGRDLTSLAHEGKLDPVIGREKEIERVVQILSRRKKNNPVLIGEPGIGKTAIVEGLAQKIIEKNIPQVLENKRVVNLDMASIVAGTKYRGQFEERLKALMVELQKNENIIIFIDELHTIVGAGGSEGSLDASNIFKPALSRGEIQCVGATTLDEYRKYIEKDGALARRFQTIMVDPPNTSETVQILMGLRHRYEDHHKVTYSDKAIEAAVKLAERYISDRFHPDKAIDVIDEAGARKRLSSMEIPPEIRQMDLEINEVVKEKEKAVEHQEFEKAAKLRDKQEKLKETLLEKKALWRKSKSEERLLVDEPTIIRGHCNHDRHSAVAPGRRRIKEIAASSKTSFVNVLSGKTRRWRPWQKYSALPCGFAQRQTADRLVHFPGADRRGQNRTCQDPRRKPVQFGRCARSHRHVGIHGEVRGVAPCRRASRIRGLRRGRAAQRKSAKSRMRSSFLTKSKRRIPTFLTSCFKFSTTACSPIRTVGTLISKTLLLS